MPNGMRWVGLDVHAHASTVAVFDDVTGEVITRRVVGRPLEVLDVLRELPRPVRAVYEAGPTGYGLVRRARAEGIEMAVCSPGNIERRPGDRIKTDKRDAIRLARLLAAGDLRLVWVPSEEHEQLRDLVRCREDLRADLMRARHRLATFLLRRERCFPGRRSAGRSSTAIGSASSTSTTRRRGSRMPITCTRTTSWLRAATTSGRELERLAPECACAPTIARLCCLPGGGPGRATRRSVRRQCRPRVSPCAVRSVVEERCCRDAPSGRCRASSDGPMPIPARRCRSPR
jgi:transposase